MTSVIRTGRARFVGRINFLGLFTGLLLLGIWQALVSSGVLIYSYLPAPSAIWSGGVELGSSGDLWPNLVHTLWVTLAGWAIAAAIGVMLGILLGLSHFAWRYSMATIEVLRALPVVAFVPAAILVFGFSGQMELVITVYAAAWPILINTIDGVRGVHPGLLDVGKTLRMSRSDQIGKLILPAALPVILIGLRLGLTTALVLAVVAEMIGNPDGLGYQLVFQERALQPEKMFAYVVIIGILGLVLNMAVIAAARFLPGSRWFRGDNQ